MSSEITGFAASTISDDGKAARIAPRAGVVITASPIQFVDRTSIFRISPLPSFSTLFTPCNLAVKDCAFTRIPDRPCLKHFRSRSSAKATSHNINPMKFRKLMFGDKISRQQVKMIFLPGKNYDERGFQNVDMETLPHPHALILFPDFKPTCTGETA